MTTRCRISTSAARAAPTWSTRSSGRSTARPIGRSRCAAPTASGPGRASTSRASSSASTRSSIAAPRRSCATSNASCTRTWKTRSSASSTRSTTTSSSPRTSSPSRVALDDAVGHQLEGAVAAGQRLLGFGDELERAGAHIGERPRRSDRVARRLRLLRCGDRAQVELQAALAREDERQRHGAVEQVGPPVLAGALGRPRHVEHVVEELEGEADASAELAELLGGPRRLQGAELAGRAEERTGLQLATAQVALGGDVVAPGVLALQQLAGGQRGGGVAERADLVGAPVARQL